MTPETFKVEVKVLMDINSRLQCCLPPTILQMKY